MERLGGKDLDRRIVEAGYRGKQGREDFARLVGITRRTLEGWVTERGSVPERKIETVEDALSGRLKLTDPLERLHELSNLGLISELQHIVAVLTARLDDPTPRDEPSQEPSEDIVERPNVGGRPTEGVIDGSLGRPTRRSIGDPQE